MRGQMLDLPRSGRQLADEARDDRGDGLQQCPRSASTRRVSRNVRWREESLPPMRHDVVEVRSRLCPFDATTSSAPQVVILGAFQSPRRPTWLRAWPAVFLDIGARARWTASSQPGSDSPGSRLPWRLSCGLKTKCHHRVGSASPRDQLSCGCTNCLAAAKGAIAFQW